MSSSPVTLPHGAWPSPISAELLVADAVRLSEIALDRGVAYWVEGRPAEGGRNVLVREREDGSHEDVTPAPFNVRTRVHEYGGRAFAVAGGRVWFVSYDDQCIYHHRIGEPPVRLTAPDDGRFAEPVLDAARNRLICVREVHADGEVINQLAAVDLDGGAVEALAGGHDFFAAPRLSPDGSRLAWLTWDHPDMPWDAARLWSATLSGAGAPDEARALIGGDDVSAFQPEWSPAGELYVVADPHGWWNLYRFDEGSEVAISREDAEYGRPLWGLGMRTYGFDAAGAVVACRCQHGSWTLERIDTRTGARDRIETGLDTIDQIAIEGDRVLLLGGGPRRLPEVVSLDLDSGRTRTLRRSQALDIDPEALSLPEAITFPTGDGEVAHGFFYPPASTTCVAPDEERPPLIVMGHGGPTGATSTVLSPRIQYWTTRGFSVLDVNYRGSTGYGRAYRDRLRGAWGVADVEDCVSGVRYLAGQGRVDGDRAVIRGGSAGGYTTLAALTFHDVFRAGASYYGIGDLEALAKDTHKFESRYLDRLIGPYPERRDRYLERSPIHHVDGLSCPVIFFQGLEDRVVPPNQSEAMVEVLAAKGIPVAYLAFEGEQHGFRRAATIMRTIEAELYFYGRVFGFEPAGKPEPVEIRNL